MSSLCREPTKFPTGRSDIIPPPCCGLSSSLLPTRRPQSLPREASKSRHLPRIPLPISSRRSPPLSVGAKLHETQNNTETLRWQLGSPGSRHYSALWTGPPVTAAAGPIYHNTHPNYFMRHSNQTRRTAPLSSHLSSSMDPLEKSSATSLTSLFCGRRTECTRASPLPLLQSSDLKVFTLPIDFSKKLIFQTNVHKNRT